MLLEGTMDFIIIIIIIIIIFRMKKFQTKSKHTSYVEQIFFFENRAVYEIMCKKCCRSRQVTGGSMADAHCMLDN